MSNKLDSVWPKFKRTFCDPKKGSKIISQVQAKKLVDARSFGWLVSGAVVGQQLKDGGWIYGYTLEDSVRDAAPVLLVALKQLRSDVKELCSLTGTKWDECEGLQLARSAIAEAEGKTER